MDRKRSNTKFLELCLHHVEDLGKVLDKIANLLRAGGTLIVVEFA